MVNSLFHTCLVNSISSTMLVCNKQNTNTRIEQEVRNNNDKSNFTWFDNPSNNSYSTAMIRKVDHPSKFPLNFLLLDRQPKVKKPCYNSSYNGIAFEYKKSRKQEIEKLKHKRIRAINI